MNPPRLQYCEACLGIRQDCEMVGICSKCPARFRADFVKSRSPVKPPHKEPCPHCGGQIRKDLISHLSHCKKSPRLIRRTQAAGHAQIADHRAIQKLGSLPYNCAPVGFTGLAGASFWRIALLRSLRASLPLRSRLNRALSPLMADMVP